MDIKNKIKSIFLPEKNDYLDDEEFEYDIENNEEDLKEDNKVHLNDLSRVKYDYRELKDIENQTEEMCLLAVKQDGTIIEFVKDKTYKVCMEAVKQTYKSLKYITNQNEDICIEAVKQNYRALYYINNKTENVLIEAIKMHQLMMSWKYLNLWKSKQKMYV